MSVLVDTGVLYAITIRMRPDTKRPPAHSNKCTTASSDSRA